jgi:carbon storage regulator
MLILTRKQDQAIIIDGDIEVRVLDINKYGQIRLGITAPDEVTVHREEIHEKIKASGVKRER